ncbi:hypothetical protein VitviT2T_004527 [Vitis vinifera]|uniref:PORR domain-containing protein n=2 Tax=Vitis vinifera TaxID=29760 RepID=A0A438EXX8_VITVI|nr:hypothetical protein CK203_077354 [Vitis vinifera]RVX17430.1 hypothetical protein CK203_003680 [Vitis vinifera]WJZ84955.1 hypothetical protein VitviT2T_004527 [Vitis vinifera]
MRVSRVIGTVVWLNSSKYASRCKESLQQTRLMTTRSEGGLWYGMTKEAEDLVAEEEGLLEQHGDKAAEHVTRFLMMLIDKQLPDAQSLEAGSQEFDKRAVAAMHELLSFTIEKREKRFSMYLTEAYAGSDPIEKGPLVLWKEKVQGLIEIEREETIDGLGNALLGDNV